MKKLVSYPFGSTLKRLLKHISKENKLLFVNFAFFTIAATIYPFFGVVLPKLLVKELRLGVDSNIINIVCITGGYFVLAGVFGFIKNIILNYSYPKVTFLRINLFRDLFYKFISIDYKYAEDAKFAENNDKAFNSCNGNGNGIELVYHKLFEVPADLLVILVLVIFIGRLNLLVLLGLGINLITQLYINKKVQAFEYSKKKDIGHAQRRMQYYNKTTHDFSFGKDIRVYNLRTRITDNYTKEINSFVNVHILIKNKEYILGLIGLITLLISNIITYGILIYKTINGMFIEDFTMYLLAITTLSTMLTKCVDDIAIMYREGQYAWDFFEFIEGDLFNSGGKYKLPDDDTLEIEFIDVSFKYPNTEKYIFENLNFKINKGEKLAIVGINGAGKTTLVKLMTGLFDITKGEILINKVNIKDYDKLELYKMFSIVFQEVIILPLTLKENIACGSDNIDEERIIECLYKVGLKDKVLSYKKGINQIMSKIIDEDGTDMSGGERQKLSIARALYKNANMVIMDEPTAALDALAEAEIYKEFSDLVEGKTAVYISHRLASTKFCDKIALFDDKKLLEYGNHDELMNIKGKYYDMFMIQGKYYQKEEVVNETV